MLKIFIMLAVFLVLPGFARAADHYVSTTGSGSSCSLADPCPMITGVAAAQPGDVVFFQPGTYSTVLDTVRAGTLENPITFKPSGSNNSAILSAGVVVDWGYVVIDGFEITSATVNGIRVDGGVNGTSSDRDYGRDGINQNRHYYANGADYVVLKNNYVHSTNGDGIKISRADYILVENNTIHGPLATSGQGIDILASYHAVVRENSFDGTATPMTHGIFAKGGSEDVLIENNTFENIPSPYSAIEIGQDTEYYNTRYTPANIDPAVHANILTWPVFNGAEGDWYGYPTTPTATGGGANFVEDSTASFNGSVSTVIPGMHLIKVVVGPPTIEACTCTISAVSATRLDCSDNLHQTANYGPYDCTSFSAGNVYRVRDPITNAGTYVAETMAEARNAIVRNNLIINSDPPLSVRNGVNVDMYHNTSINSGMTQRWVKLWNDNSPCHVSKNVRVFNNLFYNDLDHPITSYVNDKQVGTSYPGNLVGWLSDYNLRWNAATSSAGTSGNLPAGNETHGIALAPIFGNGYALAQASPGVDAAYDVAQDLNNVFTQDNSGYMTDFFGNLRGNLSDIGAYEFISSGDIIAPSSPSGLSVM